MSHIVATHLVRRIRTRLDLFRVKDCLYNIELSTSTTRLFENRRFYKECLACRSFSSSQIDADIETPTHTFSVEGDESGNSINNNTDTTNELPIMRRKSEVLISEVLKAKHSFRWFEPVISRNASVKEAIQTTIEGGLSGMMVLDTDENNSNIARTMDSSPSSSHKRIVGLITSRDLLRIMASGIKDGLTNDQILDESRVGDFMTPISQAIFARPDETVGMCRTIMARLGIKVLPVLSRKGEVEGIITARDMSDFGLSAKEKGGKQAYLNDISERVGLSSNTSMAEPPNYLKAHLALERKPLFLNVGIAHLPHPFKTATGAGRSKRDIQQSEYTSDPALSDDAHFCTTVYFPDGEGRRLVSYTYLGVADGVGSWREYGIDPKEFSRTLMEECKNVILEAAHSCEKEFMSHPLSGNTHMKALDGRMHKLHHILSPGEVMSQAYDRVKADNIVGSSTACIALFDGIRHQLHFSNLGDSGLIVLRHIDSDVAGSLKRDRSKTRSERQSDLQVAFVSQQQLRSFNHPYQLGWIGEQLKQGESTSFKEPKDACTTSIHVRRGDIIILATDGLFDNVEVDDIAMMCLDWEQRNGFIRGGDIAARERRWSMGNSMTTVSMERIGDLANDLCTRARENSVRKDVDSPFAILAKENDIMWSGGMPDDCTVLVVHVTGKDANDENEF